MQGHMGYNNGYNNMHMQGGFTSMSTADKMAGLYQMLENMEMGEVMEKFAKAVVPALEEEFGGALEKASLNP